MAANSRPLRPKGTAQPPSQRPLSPLGARRGFLRSPTLLDSTLHPTPCNCFTGLPRPFVARETEAAGFSVFGFRLGKVERANLGDVEGRGYISFSWGIYVRSTLDRRF